MQCLQQHPSFVAADDSSIFPFSLSSERKGFVGYQKNYNARLIGIPNIFLVNSACSKSVAQLSLLIGILSENDSTFRGGHRHLPGLRP